MTVYRAITQVTGFKVGDFVSYTMVTDTQVYEVVKVTPKTITIRHTSTGDVLWTDGAPYPVVYREAVREPYSGSDRVLRVRKDGTYRVGDWARPLTIAQMIDGKPVSRTDYKM
jgi:hypothetical protein